MKPKIFSLLLAIYLVLFHVTYAYPKDDAEIPDEQISTINNNIVVEVFGYKKTKHYTAVELGFTNNANQYVEFTPKEIFLNDKVKYSVSLLTTDQIASIEEKKPGLALFPTALGVGLGIAALATSRYNGDVAYGLAMGALSVGGLALLTNGLENRAKQNKLIMFENNSLEGIKKLPPGMTLGGVLYFQPTKKPDSLTIMARSKSGSLEKNNFPLKK